MVLGGCATGPQDQSFPAQAALIGKTKQEVLACAGSPLGETRKDEAVVLTYFKHAPPFEESFAESKASRPAVRHGCAARVTLKDDRVTDVRYQSVPERFAAYDHCEEIFTKCAQ
jgi:hypothetical protein